jgi:hypothetical protein
MKSSMPNHPQVRRLTVGAANLWHQFWQLSRQVQSLVLGTALLLTGWTTLYFSRSDYVVEGTIREVVAITYPWTIGDRFDLVVQTKSGGWLRLFSLRGSCDETVRFKVACLKNEFPIGSVVRLEVSGFFDPNACPLLSRFRRDRSCSLHVLDNRVYVHAIDVGGRPVITGWSSNLSAGWLYAFVAALCALFAWHEWQWSNIRVRTLLVFLVAGLMVCMAPASYF